MSPNREIFQVESIDLACTRQVDGFGAHVFLSRRVARHSFLLAVEATIFWQSAADNPVEQRRIVDRFDVFENIGTIEKSKNRPTAQVAAYRPF